MLGDFESKQVSLISLANKTFDTCAPESFRKIIKIDRTGKVNLTLNNSLFTPETNFTKMFETLKTPKLQTIFQISLLTDKQK